MTHRTVCKGDFNQIEKLEGMNVDEYYCAIDTFLKEIEKAEAQQEPKKIKS